jgi:hypothetical protein
MRGSSLCGARLTARLGSVQIAFDLQFVIAVIVAIAGFAALLALRGPLRFIAFIAGLLLAAYMAGLLDSIRLPTLSR